MFRHSKVKVYNQNNQHSCTPPHQNEAVILAPALSSPRKRGSGKDRFHVKHGMTVVLNSGSYPRQRGGHAKAHNESNSRYVPDKRTCTFSNPDVIATPITVFNRQTFFYSL